MTTLQQEGERISEQIQQCANKSQRERLAEGWDHTLDLSLDKMRAFLNEKQAHQFDELLKRYRRRG